MDPKSFYSTKAKRAAALARIQEMAASIGIECEHEDAPLSTREVWVRLSFGPYRCNVDLDGDTNVGAYLAHWHMSHGPDGEGKTYPTAFGLFIGGDVNQYHKRKATTCVETFDDLLHCLESGFAKLQHIETKQVAA